MKYDNQFDRIYDRYYNRLVNKIHEKLSNGNNIFPSESERKRIIDESSQLPCSYRFIDQLDEDKLDALFTNDKKFPFFEPVTNKAFFKLIHPSYLVPYLVYAKFAYDLATRVKITGEQLLNLTIKLLCQSNFQRTMSIYGICKKVEYSHLMSITRS
jgi:hypothetical protein